MKYSPSEYARILYKTKDSNAFLELLQKHYVLAWLPKITEEFKYLIKKEEHIEEVSVTSAYSLSAGVKDNIVRLLGSVEKGKKLELHFTVDKHIIGGVHIESSSLLIPMSALDSIQKMFNY